MLSAEKFLSVVNMTQIVSIDLIVKNDKGQILLGKRKNSPAKGFYFVPGGRLFKNETIKEGSRRIVSWELGVSEDIRPKPRCVSEHIYNDNFADAKDADNNVISTHYVCFAFDLDLDEYDESTFKNQHMDAIWITPEEILQRDDVHEYVKLYFTPDAYNRFES
jgi:colanic acid biosynthesis protein WcaH